MSEIMPKNERLSPRDRLGRVVREFGTLTLRTINTITYDAAVAKADEQTQAPAEGIRFNLAFPVRDINATDAHSGRD